MSKQSTDPEPRRMQGLPLFDREAKQLAEARALAPYALRSADSLGRSHPEPADPLRTEWERDRDRIIHCTAFRRLMYKAQVFVNREGDHNRTRLSHSLEVAQVARSVGSALSLNETLCETLGLAHDIGHPPFGHRGEWALNELLEAYGGFRHNSQVLRVVDQLERRSPDYPGLNLTREVREALLKHEPAAEWPAEFGARASQPCLEAQVTDLADSTAYNAHDVEDGLRAAMFSEEDLASECAIVRRAHSAIEARHPGFLASSQDASLRIKRVATELIKICISDLIQSSSQALSIARPEDPTAVRSRSSMLIEHSPELRAEVAELVRFLFERFYRHPHLQALTEHAATILGLLFERYLSDPREMAPWYGTWAHEVGVERAIGDYLAGMTDRFAEREYERFTGERLAD